MYIHKYLESSSMGLLQSSAAAAAVNSFPFVVWNLCQIQLMDGWVGVGCGSAGCWDLVRSSGGPPTENKDGGEFVWGFGGWFWLFLPFFFDQCCLLSSSLSLACLITSAT